MDSNQLMGLRRPLRYSDAFTAPPETYTLSLHDALPIFPARAGRGGVRSGHRRAGRSAADLRRSPRDEDRKSTRLNSSHSQISYAVFCLKKKRQIGDQVVDVLGADRQPDEVVGHAGRLLF